VCVHAGVFARLSAGVRDRRLVEAITSVMFHNVDHTNCYMLTTSSKPQLQPA
jgi:hypothetical protein